MTVIYKTALVPYSTAQMFSLVNNITDYPKFLPWCTEATLHEHTASQVIASIKMGKAGLEHSFTTTNVIKENESIEMCLLKGPFSQLQGHWTFQQLGTEGSKISLNLEFDISNRLLRLSLGTAFSKIMNTLVEAFVTRAHALYGK